MLKLRWYSAVSPCRRGPVKSTIGGGVDMDEEAAAPAVFRHR
jgi:hypothetical protein